MAKRREREGCIVFWQLASQLPLPLHLAHATLTAAHTHTHRQAQAMQIGDCIKNGGNFSNYFKWQFVSNACSAIAKNSISILHLGAVCLCVCACVYVFSIFPIWLAFLDSERGKALYLVFRFSSNFQLNHIWLKPKIANDTSRPICKCRFHWPNVSNTFLTGPEPNRTEQNIFIINIKSNLWLMFVIG